MSGLEIWCRPLTVLMNNFVQSTLCIMHFEKNKYIYGCNGSMYTF